MDAAAFVTDVRRAVEARLRVFLDTRVKRARAEGAAPAALAETAAQMTLRGGKRLRAAWVAGGALVAGERTPSDVTVAAGAAMEVLQTYLLVHDDWMDGDETRRGGPSAHVELGRRWGARQGAAGAVLAGDLASAWSRALLVGSGASAERLAAALAVWNEMEEDVILGQTLDVVPNDAADDVPGERVVTLKTTSYTVRGPLRLGAVLAGANASLLAALDAYATPVGAAFQLRDDVLGLLGDPAETGKPVGADLLRGKRTPPLLHALAKASDAERAVVERAFGRPEATARELEAALAVIGRLGVAADAEVRIRVLLDEASAALDRTACDADGRALLAALARRAAERPS